MKKLSGRFYSLIVLAIVFVIWNILAWACVDWKTIKPDVFFYCGYGFIALSFVLVGCVLAFYRAKKNVIFSVLLPSYLVSGAYMLINFIFNTVLMCMPEKDNVKVAVMPNAILLLLFVIGMVVCYIAIAHIGGKNDVIDKQVSAIKTLSVELGQIAALSDDAEVRQAIAALREEVDYSDPIGVEATADLEKDVNKGVAEIRMLVEGKYDSALVKDKVTATRNKLRQRNELLRASK